MLFFFNISCVKRKTDNLEIKGFNKAFIEKLEELDSLYINRINNELLFNNMLSLGLLTGVVTNLKCWTFIDYMGNAHDTLYYNDSIYFSDRESWLKWYDKNKQEMSIENANLICLKNYLKMMEGIDNVKIDSLPDRFKF